MGKKPPHKIFIDTKNFRHQLRKYSIKELEEYVNSYETYRKEFSLEHVNYVLTYLIEKKGIHTLEKTNLNQIGIEMKKGFLIAENAGNGTGSYMKGGSIFIAGDAGWGTGMEMEGGTIIIGGNSGSEAGSGMGGGTILVFGNMEGNTGIYFRDGKIICFGKMKDISKKIEGGKIYADKFENDTEKYRKLSDKLENIPDFIPELDIYFKKAYGMLNPESRENVRKAVRRYPKKFYSYANNLEMQKLFADILKKTPEEVALEHEKSRSGMW